MRLLNIWLCCRSDMLVPDVCLLSHVSINVNVFWFVKHVARFALQSNQNLSDVFFYMKEIALWTQYFQS